MDIDHLWYSGCPSEIFPTSTDRALDNNENIRVLKEGGRHMLVITHVSSEDEGFYTVVARNQHGTAECSADLYIQEPRTAISSQM